MLRRFGNADNPSPAPAPPPHRELANQIFGVVSKFAELLDEAKPLLLVGGTSVEDCLASFRKNGASILVGTPGRVEDMLNNYSVFDARGGCRSACGVFCLCTVRPEVDGQRTMLHGDVVTRAAIKAIINFAHEYY